MSRAYQDGNTDVHNTAIGCNPDDFELVAVNFVVESSVYHVNRTVVRVNRQGMNTSF